MEKHVERAGSEVCEEGDGEKRSVRGRRTEKKETTNAERPMAESKESEEVRDQRSRVVVVARAKVAVTSLLTQRGAGYLLIENTEMLKT